MDQASLGIEKAREQRINSNMERMKQLGILNLSHDVNSISQSLTPKKRGRDMLRKEKPIETSNITTKKRGRGRPRKEEIKPIETSKITPRNWWHLRTRSIEVKMDRAPLGIEKAVEERQRQRQIETSNITPEKRGRGRPRKHHERTCEAPSIDTLSVKIEALKLLDALIEEFKIGCCQRLKLPLVFFLFEIIILISSTEQEVNATSEKEEK